MMDDGATADLASCAAFLHKRLAAAGGVLVVSGAGASADSGIATFRGGSAGWWTWALLALGTASGWAWTPSWVSGPLYRRFFLAQVRAARPNAFHRVVAAHPGARVLTQNVDGLHQKAGTPPRNVAEMHGTVLDDGMCLCGAAWPCATCPGGGKWRPSALLFRDFRGRTCTPADMQRMVDECINEAAPLVLVVGLSGQVRSGFGAVRSMARAGATVVVVNPDALPEFDGAIYMRHGAGALFSAVEEI